MKFNSVILVDDSESCDIANLFVMMKDSTAQLLEQYATSHEDIDAKNHVYLSDTVTKQNLAEKMSLVNSDSFVDKIQKQQDLTHCKILDRKCLNMGK